MYITDTVYIIPQISKYINKRIYWTRYSYQNLQ